MELKLLNKEELARLFEEELVVDFPRSELKPLSAMYRLMDLGLYEPLRVLKDGQSVGYALAWLPSFLKKLGDDDIVMITADHGCDPAYTTTSDHTREYVPLLVLGKRVKPVNLGTRASFADIAATAAELLGVELDTPGESFANLILADA